MHALHSKLPTRLDDEVGINLKLKLKPKQTLIWM